MIQRYVRPIMLQRQEVTGITQPKPKRTKTQCFMNMPITFATTGFECHRGSPSTIIRTPRPALTSIASLARKVPSRSTDICRIPRIVTVSDPPSEAPLRLFPFAELVDACRFSQFCGLVDTAAPSLTSRKARAENAVRSPCVIVPTKSSGKTIVTQPVSELAVSRNRRPVSLVYGIPIRTRSWETHYMPEL